MNSKMKKTGPAVEIARDPFRLTKTELSKVHEIIYSTAKEHGVPKKFADSTWRNFKTAFKEARTECIKKFGDQRGVHAEGIRKTHKLREKSSGDGFPNRRGSRMNSTEEFDP